MESVIKINFESGITRETSMSPILEDLGNAKCTMELFTDVGTIQRNGEGRIEWIVEFLDEKGELDGDEEVEYIGVWFEKKTLTEYDGVFSLPTQAIQLLRKVGIRVPREFEN